MYEIGKVYIWVGLAGALASYNGLECTVLGRPVQWREKSGQPTDTKTDCGANLYAERGDLRPKRPPPGERSVMELFRNAAPVPVVMLSDAAFERLVRDLE